MTIDLKDVIESLRAVAGDGDEWNEYDRFVPFQVVMATGPSEEWMYTTKLAAFQTMVPLAIVPDRVGFVSRYGIPTEATIDLVRRVTGPAAVIKFLGDLDPLDLTVYLLLSERMPIEYIGVDEKWIVAADSQRRQPPSPGTDAFDRFCIRMTPFEQRHWSLLKETGSRFIDELGEIERTILDSGRKIELEAVLNERLFQPRHDVTVSRLLSWS